MGRKFVNFTNHPSSQWEEKQIKAAQQYGEIVDVPFPAVDPLGDEVYIEKLAGQYVERIMELQPRFVLCQGEFCLTFKIVEKLKANHIEVAAACSERRVKEEGNRKEVVFVFEHFRKY